VTSRLRATPLTDVPASLTVLDEQAIRQTSVQHFEELTRLIPNMNWSGEGNRARYFQLRGTGELEQYEGAPNPSVGFIIDDIDFSAIGGVATTFDTERIEVLRGPQGTRYGANALAGLVYVRTAEPSEATEAYLEATGGNDDTWSIGGAAGGPVPGTDAQLLYRAAVQQYQSDGFRDNAFFGADDTYNRDELTARGKLRWLPNDDWQVDLSALYIDLDNGYDAFAIDNGFTVYSDKPGDDAQETFAGALRVEGRLSDALSLVSITGAGQSDIDFSFDADWGNDEFWAPFVYDFIQAFDRERDTLNQELRLVSGPDGALFGGRADWVLGAYLLDLEESNFRVDQGIYDDDFFCDPCRLDATLDSNYEATSYAVFGELDTALNDRTRLVLGLRWETRSADYADTAGNAFDPTDRMWGGELALTRDLTDDLQAYARIARGYKAGGFNIGLAGVDLGDTGLNISEGQIQFDPESMWNYEAGLRAAGANWSADVAVFYQDRDDMQVKIPVQLRSGDPTTFVFITDNAESGSSYGLEATARWAITESLSLHVAAGWLQTEIDEFVTFPALAGREFAHAPAYTFNAGAIYTGGSGWFARLDVSGKDEFFFDFSHDQESDAYATVDLRLGKAWDHWAVELWGRNVLDEDYAVRGFFFGNEPPEFPDTLYTRLGDPRHYGVTVRYTY
jgi:outer membrane receptor protein involved in Fe transport